MIINLKSIYKDKGLIICLIVSIVVLIVFFQDLLFHPNSKFFGFSGDGMQTYYNSWYHVLYDRSYLYQEAMNYPFKESVFFTACQPMVTNFIKFFGLSAYTIGILNLTMLFSLPLSAVFLYFTFKEFKVNYILGALAAVVIAYLTPQIARMSSHYTLTYFFAIPAIIWLMIKFYNSPSYKKTIAIAFLVFFMASTHMYFFIFYGLIITSVWCSYFYKNGIKNTWLIFLKHYSIQLLLPFLVLQIIIFVLNEATDRTTHPWGFLEYVSNWSGVFYPTGRWYENIFIFIGLQRIYVDWEGEAFVGICAIFVTIFFLFKIIYNIVFLKFRTLFNFTPYPE